MCIDTIEDVYEYASDPFEAGFFHEIRGPYTWRYVEENLSFYRATTKQKTCKVSQPLILPIRLLILLVQDPCGASTVRRIGSWTYEEETLLIGSVFMVFAERGSLFPARRMGSMSAGYTKQCESDTFESVSEVFEECKVLAAMQHLPPRTPKALCRHFKQMKGRYIVHRTHSTGGRDGFLQHVEDWMLLCGRHFLREPGTVSLPECRRSSSWSAVEEAVLVGAVFERFFRKGSLCSSRRGELEIGCWEEIAQIYSRASSRLGLTTPAKRAPKEIESQYRSLKKRVVNPAHGAPGLKPYIEAYIGLGYGFPAFKQSVRAT